MKKEGLWNLKAECALNSLDYDSWLPFKALEFEESNSPSSSFLLLLSSAPAPAQAAPVFAPASAHIFAHVQVFAPPVAVDAVVTAADAAADDDGKDVIPASQDSVDFDSEKKG